MVDLSSNPQSSSDHALKVNRITQVYAGRPEKLMTTNLYPHFSHYWLQRQKGGYVCDDCKTIIAEPEEMPQQPRCLGKWASQDSGYLPEWERYYELCTIEH